MQAGATLTRMPDGLGITTASLGVLRVLGTLGILGKTMWLEPAHPPSRRWRYGVTSRCYVGRSANDCLLVPAPHVLPVLLVLHVLLAVIRDSAARIRASVGNNPPSQKKARETGLDEERGDRAASRRRAVRRQPRGNPLQESRDRAGAAFPRSGESGTDEREYAIFQVRLNPTGSGGAA